METMHLYDGRSRMSGSGIHQSPLITSAILHTGGFLYTPSWCGWR